MYHQQIIDRIAAWKRSFPQEYGVALCEQSPLKWHDTSPPPSNWLGSPSVVADIVSTFIIRCVHRHIDLNAGSFDHTDFTDAADVARHFLGANDVYTSAKGWNEPGAIDQFIKTHMSMDETTAGEIVARLLGETAAAIFKKLQPKTNRQSKERWIGSLSGLLRTPLNCWSASTIQLRTKQ